jgi:hypothetical protein
VDDYQYSPRRRRVQPMRRGGIRTHSMRCPNSNSAVLRVSNSGFNTVSTHRPPASLVSTCQRHRSRVKRRPRRTETVLELGSIEVHFLRAVARVAKLADAPDLGSGSARSRGSSPLARTIFLRGPATIPGSPTFFPTHLDHRSPPPTIKPDPWCGLNLPRSLPSTRVIYRDSRKGPARLRASDSALSTKMR